MATAVEMPKLGNTVEECLLAKWRKAEGDHVAAGEIIAEIETDKAVFELSAPVEGTLLGIFFEEGMLVPVYTKICVIGGPGESIDAFRPAAEPIPEHSPPKPAEAALPPVPAIAGNPGAILSPRARKLAAELGFTPPPAAGSGPGGRLLEQDVRSLYQAAPEVSPPARMSSLREKIARRMRESLSASAQYTLHTSAAATGLLALRGKIKTARASREIPDVNINDLVMFATVRALSGMPELNAELIEGRICQRAEIHLGFACDTGRGLLVPVVRNCEKLSLAQLHENIDELTERALAGAIGPDDLTGATFTVSNLGNLGIHSFTPILNSPQVALLGVGSIELKPVRGTASVEFVDHIGLSLTCDHQVIDGAPGARFLKVVREKIESIESLADLGL